MPKFNVVTCFKFEDYEKYGKRFVQTFEKFWPRDVKLHIYTHDVPPETNIGPWINLDENDSHKMFYERFGQVRGETPQGYNYRMDAAKFSHKVFAIGDALKSVGEGDYLIWLDADTETIAPVPPEMLPKWVCEDGVSHLGRTAINYSETSFIGLSDASGMFWGDMLGVLLSGEFLNYREWHDGFIFERLLNIHRNNGLLVTNLSPECKDLEAFNSVFGKYMTHYKGNKKDVAPVQQGGPRLVINAKDSVNPQVIQDAVKKNSEKITHWIQPCKRHSDAMIIVSAGPSYLKELDNIKSVMNRLALEGKNPKVLCVKHAHNTLIENGIIPWGCVLLDPRPFNEPSTTGHIRKDLIANPHPSTKYFVATMSNDEIIDYLNEKGAKVIGWDAFTNALVNVKLPKGRFFITGGTCAAMRSISIGHTLGFREFHLFGFDACMPKGTKVDLDAKLDNGQQKYLQVEIDIAEGKDKKNSFVTTGEWAAFYQDFEKLTKEIASGIVEIDLNVYGEGMIQTWYRNAPKLEKGSFHQFERNLYL